MKTETSVCLFTLLTALTCAAQCPPTQADSFQSLFSFNVGDGYMPQSLADVGGTLYGTTQAGGILGSGVMFSYTPSSGVFNDPGEFIGPNGFSPAGPLLADGSLLYGTTPLGGPNTPAQSGSGNIFSFNPATDSLINVADFSGANGKYPYSGLTDVGGTLYGTTSSGGASGHGDVFAFDPATGAIIDRADFTGTNGSLTVAGLTAFGGTLYGDAQSGGAHGFGDVFSFNPSTGALNDLADFTSANGSSPTAPLLAIGNTLYGVALGGANGKGDVFSFTPSTGTLADIADFSGINGYLPNSLIAGPGGLLYGTTAAGGATTYGTVFSVDPTTGAITDQHDFGFSDGAGPNTLLTEGGVLYGTTAFGGQYALAQSGGGTLFALTPNVPGSAVPEPPSAALALLGLPLLLRWPRSVRRARHTAGE